MGKMGPRTTNGIFIIKTNFQLGTNGYDLIKGDFPNTCLLKKAKKHTVFLPVEPKFNIHNVTGDTKMHLLAFFISHSIPIYNFTLI